MVIKKKWTTDGKPFETFYIDLNENKMEYKILRRKPDLVFNIEKVG